MRGDWSQAVGLVELLSSEERKLSRFRRRLNRPGVDYISSGDMFPQRPQERFLYHNRPAA